MIIRTLFVVAALLLTGPFVGFADEHPLTDIVGTGVHLKSYDHAIAGSIRDFVIFGNKDEGKFRSELLMKRDGQVIRAVFEKKGSHVGGAIEHTAAEGVLRRTAMELVSVDTDRQVITVAVNGREIPVEIRGESFENGHFTNPSYRAVVDGEEIRFAMTGGGRACYGYSTHLIFMILGAYLH